MLWLRESLLLLLPRVGERDGGSPSVDIWKVGGTTAGVSGKPQNFFHARVLVGWLMPGVLKQV